MAVVQGQPERAARLLGASAALRKEMGTPLHRTLERITTAPWTLTARCSGRRLAASAGRWAT